MVGLLAWTPQGNAENGKDALEASLIPLSYQTGTQSQSLGSEPHVVWFYHSEEWLSINTQKASVSGERSRHF